MKSRLFLFSLFLVFSVKIFAAGNVIFSGGGGPGGVTIHEAVIVNNHTYEYNTLDNPMGYYWCGHAAYKVAVDASLNGRDTLNMQNIHNIFLPDYYYKNHLNCGGYNAEYCASFQNLEDANSYYSFNNISDSYPSNYANMFTFS